GADRLRPAEDGRGAQGRGTHTRGTAEVPDPRRPRPFGRPCGEGLCRLAGADLHPGRGWSCPLQGRHGPLRLPARGGGATTGRGRGREATWLALPDRQGAGRSPLVREPG